MKTVRDDTGTYYLLLERSEDASLVRDPATGNECYVRNDRLESVDDPPLSAAARGIDDSVRTLLSTVHDDRTLGLLIVLADRGPTRVRTLLSATGLCESDLHGTLAVLTAAGLLAESEVAGERGYRTTDVCEAALTILRAGGNGEPDS